MAVAVADLSHLADSLVAASSNMIRVLLVHACPVFRVGLRSLLAQQDDCDIVGEATRQEDVLLLAKEQHPDIVLLDGGLTTADPLDLVQQLRQAGVQGIMVFASPLVGDCKVSENASPLSLQERTVLEQFARGGTNAQVAWALGISSHTVKNRLARIYEKLNVHDRTLAVVMALHQRWIAAEGIHEVSL